MYSNHPSSATRHLSILTGALLVFSAVDCRAQTDAPAAPQAQAVLRPVSVATNYVLKPNDEILVRVFRNVELDGPRRISSDGTIDFPHLGIVKISGKTTYEAASHLAALLDKDYLVRPQVFVTLAASAKRYFNVIGAVATSGTKELPDGRDFNILDAVAAAGGFTRYANPANIIVTRQAQGRTESFKVDANRFQKNRDSQPYIVQPNDTIEVKERIL